MSTRYLSLHIKADIGKWAYLQEIKERKRNWMGLGASKGLR